MPKTAKDVLERRRGVVQRRPFAQDAAEPNAAEVIAKRHDPVEIDQQGRGAGRDDERNRAPCNDARIRAQGQRHDDEDGQQNDVDCNQRGIHAATDQHEQRDAECCGPRIHLAAHRAGRDPDHCRHGSVSEQPDDLRLRVQRDVHIEQIGDGARDARGLVEPRRDAAQAVVHRGEAARIDHEDREPLREELRNVKDLRDSVDPRVRSFVREPKSGVRAEVQRGIPRVQQREQKLQGIDVKVGLPVVELDAAAVPERHEKRKRDEERRNERSSQHRSVRPAQLHCRGGAGRFLFHG